MAENIPIVMTGTSSSKKGEPIIRVIDLHKRFGDHHVLKGITFDILRGESFVIMGGSGCGKSTLLKQMIGAIPPTSGQILLDGDDITQISENPREMDRVRRKFGILFQSGALLNSLSVGQNVALPIKQHTELDPTTIEIMVKLKLEQVGLRDAEDRLPDQISGGMKKRAGTARAIALDPKIVFFDEPSAGLDPISTTAIDELIRDMQRNLGITCVTVTHVIESVDRIADRIIMLDAGNVVALGTKEEIWKSTDPLVKQFITGSTQGPVGMRRAKKDFFEDLMSV